MQLSKAIIAVVVVGAILGPAVLPGRSQTEAANARQAGPIRNSIEGGDTLDEGKISGVADSNDISGYYGFQQMEMVKLDWGIADLTIADFDGDGRNDIAVVNNRKARIELLTQKEAVGPGEAEVAVDPEDIDINTIDPPTRFEKQSIPVSQKLYSLVRGDLNSDGLIDLAFYGEPRGLYVMLQKAGEAEADGPKSLSWRTRKKIKIDDGLLTSHMLECADLNNDGLDDLALAGRDGVYIIAQKQDGSLAEPVEYPTSAQTLSVEVGDLNGDDINDLILVTNDIEKPVHVRFGLETGQLGPQVQFFIERPVAFMVHNIDETAGDEILTVDGLSKRLICYEFAAGSETDVDWPILLYPLASGQADTKRDLAIGDFDGDGLVDVTISDPSAAELIFYRQREGLGLAEPVRFPAFTDITSLSAVDIDGDGKTELGVLSVKEKVIGLSEFKDDRLSFPHPVNLTGEPVAMELADVDNDGATDCLFISKDDNDVRTFRTIYDIAAAESQSGDSASGEDNEFETFEEIAETAFALRIEKLSSNPDGLKVLDVDQDGLKDVLIFVSYELPILVRQVQTREFEIVDSPQAQASLIKDASLRSTAVADVDDKPGEELLVAQNNFARSLVFSEGRNWSVVDQYNAKSTENEISAVAAFDIDADSTAGRPTILLLDGRRGRLQILKAGSDKTYRVEKELDIGRWNTAAHLKMLFEPLTCSESRSLLLFDSEKFALITPPSNGNVAQHLEQKFSYETKIKDGVYGGFTAGDINRDGWTDITMIEYGGNHIEILALNPGPEPIPAMRFKIFEQKSYREGRNQARAGVEPREMRVADVTSDGKNDLVTVIHDRMIIYPQD